VRLLLLLIPLLAGCDTCWYRGQAPGQCPGDDDDSTADDDDAVDDDDIGDDDDTAPDDDDTADDDDAVGPPCAHGDLVPGSAVDAHGYDLICVQPGTFGRGFLSSRPQADDDAPRYDVTLTKWLAAGRTEVTQQLYEAVMGDNPTDCDFGCGPTNPVGRVSWVNAVAFCDTLSALEGLTSPYTILGPEYILDLDADGYRLPTEAEWEYLAKAGEDTRWPGTDDASELDEYSFCTGSFLEDYSRPVGLRLPNAWGFVDFAGNVREWVHDWYDSDFYEPGLVDPTGPLSASWRGSRGGAWFDTDNVCRVSDRGWESPTSPSDFRGFRVVRTVWSE
jgi:sulfatase modifying factor 1